MVEAVQAVMPCVVNITSEKRASSSTRWPFSPEENEQPRVSGMGTGVLIDERGFVLTNQHVVDGVEGIEVHLHDGSRHSARVVQQDPVMDMALLKIEAGKVLPAIRIGSSSDLMIGETVITVGNAYGYENTVSVGIISALNRNVTLSDEQVYRNLIQTDACINPGNSGGPLVNIQGELIGINVAVRAGAQGIGFALPIDDVKRVATEMISTRRMSATWHGIVASESTGSASRSAIVASTQPGSPAEAAGLRVGDQLVTVGSLPITNALDLERSMIDLRPGQQARVLVRRDGQEKSFSLTLASVNQTVANPDDHIWRTLGVRFVPVTKEYVAAVSAKFRGGLYVKDVSPGSPADRAEIREGDILVGMNSGDRDWETIRSENILYILSRPELARTQSIQYYLVRRNGFIQGLISLSPVDETSVRR